MSSGIILLKTNYFKMQSLKRNEINMEFFAFKNSNHIFNIIEDKTIQSPLCMPMGHLMIVIVC